MKTRFISILLALVVAISFSSCTKSGPRSLAGDYHFKMSGNLICQSVTEGYEDIVENFIVSSEAGQMHIIDDGEGGYIVTMSIMMTSYTIIFDARYDDEEETLVLNENVGVLFLKSEGTSGSILNTDPAVSVMLSGQGKMYERGKHIIFDMTANGNFNKEVEVSALEDKNLEFEILLQGITCIATKEK